MRIAVVSEDFQSLSGKPGHARRFLLFEVEPGTKPRFEDRLELPSSCPNYHDLHEDDASPHPLDGRILITSEAGEGFGERLAKRGTRVMITAERDPLTAVTLLVEGRLPERPPTPKHDIQCSYSDAQESPPA